MNTILTGCPRCGQGVEIPFEGTVLFKCKACGYETTVEFRDVEVEE